MFKNYRTPRGDRGIRRAVRSSDSLRTAYRQMAKTQDKSERLEIRKILRLTSTHSQYYSWYWDDVESNIDGATYRNCGM